MPRVDGKETLSLPRERVWELLNDPEKLGAAIPGCHGLKREDGEEHRYRTSIAVAIGAVKGVYDGTVTYADIAEPERCTIKVSGCGEKGTIDGQGEIELATAVEGTEVAYQGQFKITGPVAGVGQRLAPGIGRKMIIETLRNLGQQGAIAVPSAPELAATLPESDHSGAVRPLAEGPAKPVEPNAEGLEEPATNHPRGTGSQESVPFNPVVISGWAWFAGGFALGILFGFRFRRIL